MSQDIASSLDEIERARLFWKEKLTGVEALNLTLADDTSNWDGVHAHYEVCFGDALTKKLLKISEGNNISLYTLLLTGLKVLLYKYTGQKDITIGTPVFLKSEFNKLIPLRDIISGEMTFKELLLEIRDTILSGYKNQFYPLQKITDSIQTDELLQRIAKVLLVLENIHDFKQVIDVAHSPSNTLTIVCKNDSHKLRLHVIYNPKLLHERDMLFLIRGYESLLYLMVHHLNDRISDSCLVSDMDKEKILFEFNNTGAEYPVLKTVHELFEEQVSGIPHKIAVKHGNLSITYKELNDRANHLAGILRRKGVKKNALVLISIDCSIDLLIAILGVLKAGGAYLPIDPGHPRQRVQYIVEDSKASVLLTRGPLNSRFAFHGDIIDTSDTEQPGEDIANLQNINDSHDTACLIYTPGSTGNPNGVMIDHKGIVNLSRFGKNNLGISGEDRVLLFSNVSFAEFLWETFISLLSGAELHILPDEAFYESTKFEQFIRDNDITVITVPPLYLANLVPENIRSLKKLIISGLPAATQIAEKWKEKVECIVMYGLTEATVYAGFRKLGGTSSESGSKVIGRPVDHCGFYIIDPDGQLQSIGLPGELCISGVGIARGYFGKPERTREKFIESPYEPGLRMYKTGALARWLPDGNIELIGRLDRQIEIRGYLVEPGEVEQRILEYGLVQEVTVCRHEDKNKNRFLTAYYVSDVDIQTSELKEFLRDSLPNYMIPLYFVRVTAIPYTVNASVDVKLLPKPSDDVENEDEHNIPQNETEEIISNIWKKILKLKSVSLKKSFLELGGNSILVLKMVAELSKVYPGMISVPDIFSYPTIEQLASRIILKAAKTRDRAVSKYIDISHLSVKMPTDALKTKDSRTDDGSILSYSFTKAFCKKISRIARISGMDELRIILGAYLYTLCIISGEKEITVHVVVGSEGSVCPVSVNLSDIKDFKTLILHINQKLEKVETCDNYRIEDINKIGLKKDPTAMIPLFYNVFSYTFREELLEIYDVVVGVCSTEGEINIVFRYDGLRIQSCKANEWFSLFVNCIDEIITKLSQ